MIKTFAIPLLAFFAISIGLYPLAYLFMDHAIGLLSTKSEDLLNTPWWYIPFYTHISFGGIALLSGWPQFVESWRNAYPGGHRLSGKIYLGAVGISGIAAFFCSFFATGGIIAATGFGSLALIWLSTSFIAWQMIKQKDIERHRYWMIFSFAACFAAVTLRLWLPLLSWSMGDFTEAYKVVAWLCWVPNMAVAWGINSTFRLA